MNNPLLYTDPSGNICEGCGHGGDVGIGPGSETGGTSIDLDKLWKDSGLDKWTKKNLNFDSWGRSWKKLFGGGSSGPPPNVSKYVGNFVQSDFAQGFGKMAIQTTIDGFDLISPGFSSAFDQFGGTDYFNLTPTDNQEAGYYTAMGLTFLSPGGAEVGAEKFAQKGINWLLKGGKNFTKYKIARGGTETLAKISTSTGTQRISTEFHHAFLTQRLQKTYGLPNWMVNNRLNVWKLNSVQHSLIDSYRYNFLRAGFKTKVGWFAEYNWFTKF